MTTSNPVPTAGGRLRGEVVVVTGAARGIGRAIAERALAEAARVGLLDVDRDALHDTVTALGSGGRVAAATADITDEHAVTDAVARIADRLAAPTVLVNNAGRNAYGDATTMTVPEWDAVFSVDLRGAWLMARAVLPAMIAAGRGAVVNVASLHARLTTTGMFPYAAAKSGLVGMTRSLALDVAEHGIRVNAVSPGYIATELGEQYFDQHPDPGARQAAIAVQPLRRFGEPSEVAAVVCFLASGEAGFVTGADWAIDGGLGARFA